MATEIRIFPGSGARESLDFALMLSEMYKRWAVSKGYRAEVVYDDWTYRPEDGEGTGNALMVGIPDHNLVEKLCGENGVHRLLRVSPHDPQQRRHTSWVTVMVLDKASAPAMPQRNSSEVGAWGDEHAPSQKVWGGPVRSYCLSPVCYMIDHRTGYEDKDPQGILDGDLDRAVDRQDLPP